MYRYKINLLFLLISASSLASTNQSDKSKTFEKSYTVSNETELSIDNKFGDIEINDWDKSEFKISVEVKVEAKNENKAQAFLDAVNIEFNKSGNLVKAITKISSSKKIKNGSGFKINYTVYMPTENKLIIKNSFGDTSMGDRLGDLDLKVSYGSLKVGSVSGVSNIKLSFGSGSMDKITSGAVSIKYSSLKVEYIDNIELSQGFSNLKLGDINSLDLDSKYGDIKIKKIENLEADINYSGLKIGEVTGRVSIEASYIGEFEIEKLAKSFSLLDIEGKFGSYDINLEEGINANIEAEFSFADLRISSDLPVDFSYKVKESNNSRYKGKIGKGSDTKIIKIDSSYGNARLGSE